MQLKSGNTGYLSGNGSLIWDFSVPENWDRRLVIIGYWVIGVGMRDLVGRFRGVVCGAEDGALRLIGLITWS